MTKQIQIRRIKCFQSILEEPSLDRQQNGIVHKGQPPLDIGQNPENEIARDWKKLICGKSCVLLVFV